MEEILLRGDRIREVLSIGFIMTHDTIIWTNKWFKFIKIEEECYYIRFKNFDDGWSYKFYWSDWKLVWKFKRIIK